jgi:hypothetical protein
LPSVVEAAVAQDRFPALLVYQDIEEAEAGDPTKNGQE